MYDHKYPEHWKKAYWSQVTRNIGLVTFKEQERLRVSKIVVFGVGGIGGPLASQLVRVGCENITICDNEVFEESNLNRQICTRDDIGKYKVDFFERLASKINPDCNIEKFYEVSENNIKKIIQQASVVTLTLDDPITSILIARASAQNHIPIIESWSMPYLWYWYFTKNSKTYEDVYGFPTKDMSISEMKHDSSLVKVLFKQTLAKILQFPQITDLYDREKGTVDAILSGKHPFVSLAPFVHMTASLLAFEVVYSGVLEIKEKILAPRIKGYDYYHFSPLDFVIT